MASEIANRVAELERRADGLLRVLPFATRAFVIEFAGSPKSGKSTSVEAIRHFFVRQGFRVHVLVERASVCPIPMKGHLFFNTWCASTMLAELLSNVETDTDIIIVDRGLFDALVWLTLQRQRGELTDDEAQIIENFLLLERWRTLIDLAVLMKVRADEAIKRELAPRISRRSGSIMNPDILSALGTSVVVAAEKYGHQFRGTYVHETSGEDVRASNVRLAESILGHFQEFLDPEILVVPKGELSKLPIQGIGDFSPDAKSAIVNCISMFGRYMRRSVAEKDSEFVQIIPCGILTHKRQVFVFERKERDPKYVLYGKMTIWQGCHVSKQEGLGGEELLKSALLQRITRSLFLSRMFPLDFIGYCWDLNNEKSNRHIGVMFRVRIENDHTAVDLRKKEFRTARGHALVGGFMDFAQLTSEELIPHLEAWSAAILCGTGNLQNLERPAA